MNNLQKAAHADGFNLVATAFNKGETFNVDQSVAWLNRCLANDRNLESLQVIERDQKGDIAKVKKIEATRAELCGYRLTGIFTGLESVRAALHQRGVCITMDPSPDGSCVAIDKHMQQGA